MGLLSGLYGVIIVRGGGSRSQCTDIVLTAVRLWQCSSHNDLQHYSIVLGRAVHCNL